MTVSATPPTGIGRHPRDLTTDHRLVRWLIGATTVGAGGVVAMQHRTNPLTALALALVVLTYGRLSAIDVAEQRLPNRLTLPLAGVTMVVLMATGVVIGQVLAALTAIAVGVGFALLLGVLRFGMGDVKLAVTVGAIAGWFGRDAILATIYIGAAGGAATAVILMILHRRRDISFSFGPFLALGSIAGMLVAG